MRALRGVIHDFLDADRLNLASARSGPGGSGGLLPPGGEEELEEGL